jgi:PAS domain-containing protein
MSELKKHVSQRQSTKTELRQDAERLAGIIDSAMDAIVTIDAKHCVTLFNASAEKMFLCSFLRDFVKIITGTSMGSAPLTLRDDRWGRSAPSMVFVPMVKNFP